jgi:hypothetical protein
MYAVADGARDEACNDHNRLLSCNDDDDDVGGGADDDDDNCGRDDDDVVVVVIVDDDDGLDCDRESNYWRHMRG